MAHESPCSIKRHGTTLEKCGREPVRTPGCIQAHGVLPVLRRGDLTILHPEDMPRIEAIHPHFADARDSRVFDK